MLQAMATREAISNFFITIVVLFFMVLLGMLLKARYRLPSERQAAASMSEAPVPKAQPIPVAKVVPPDPVSQKGEFTILNNPTLMLRSANEPDTLRIKYGTKEDVFVLYFVTAVQSTWNHSKRVNDASSYFGHAPTEKILETGSEALSYVAQLLTKHPFKVYTKHGRVPETERYYALVSVETQPGKWEDLAELLVRKGFAAPEGQKTQPLPFPKVTMSSYVRNLKKAEEQARNEHAGVWAFATR
jgi:hypothetical protein